MAIIAPKPWLTHLDDGVNSPEGCLEIAMKAKIAAKSKFPVRIRLALQLIVRLYGRIRGRGLQLSHN